MYTTNLTFNLIVIASTLVLGVLAYLQWHFKYWSRIGIQTLTGTSYLYGDAKSFLLGQKTMGEQFQEFHQQFKSKGVKHGGVFLGFQPFYLPVDLEIIKNILQKNYAHFMSRGSYYNEVDDPLSASLLNLENEKWKNLRGKLSPTFTSGKMKMMFDTFVNCSLRLEDIMQNAIEEKTPLEIKEVFSRFTTDIIGSTAFGIDCNSLENPESDFRKFGKKIFEVRLLETIKIALAFSVPHSVLRFFRLTFTRPEVTNFFMTIVKNTVRYREENNIHRNDFMQLLIQLKNCESINDGDDKITDGNIKHQGLTMNELAAQAFVFFAAGFETSSTTMTWAIYELAINQDIQDQSRNEINDVLEKYDGKLTYDAVMDMTYLDKIIEETLRKYPPFAAMTRRCTKDYKIPETNITLKKNDDILISILGIHMDPEFYPDPEKFDPERFSEENKHSRPSCTWLPFGEGPRVCIGLRFGMLQTKVGLATILKKYRVKLNAQTLYPAKLVPTNFVTTPQGGMWLDVEKI